jgi:hypothetical protein
MMRPETVKEKTFLEYFNYYQYFSGRSESHRKTSALTDCLCAESRSWYRLSLCREPKLELPKLERYSVMLL